MYRMRRSIMKLTRRAERGQAATETLMLSWVLLGFFAATYQIFIANETLYRSLSTAHSGLMKNAYQRNCFRAGMGGPETDCEFKTDKANMIWNTQNLPEIRIPTINLFVNAGLKSPLYIESARSGSEAVSNCNTPQRCKKTKIGSGTAGPGPVDKNASGALLRPILSFRVGIKVIEAVANNLNPSDRIEPWLPW